MPRHRLVAILVMLGCPSSTTEYTTPPPKPDAPAQETQQGDSTTVPTVALATALDAVPESIASLYVFSLSSDRTELTFDPAPDPTRRSAREVGSGFSARDSEKGGKIITLAGGPFRNGAWVRASLKQRVPGTGERESLVRAGYDLDQVRDLLVVDGERDNSPTVFAFSADRAKRGVVGICTGVTMLDFGKPEAPIAVRKPVIYLHPPKTQRVRVQVELDGDFTAVYPKMGDDGWNVTAAPDGTLVDAATGRSSRYLFWEGTATDFEIDHSRAHCIPGDETAAFLERACARYTLSDSECTDFITYWLPEMVGAPYNVIEFVDEAVYGRYARLHVEPTPDAVIRPFMIFARAEQPVAVGAPELPQRRRGTFTVIEWGGADLGARPQR